ncbi:hypothetical protein CspHIS471_0301380 [Cutaneotrichosporon sp. HIS471]|nr:hypothetical protein CspHIS471_0301380 [Cutaneotrichosporon sp. HIS471]
MLTVNATGTPYELGRQHGEAAREKVYGTKAFYEGFFMKMAKLDWNRVEAEADKWKPFLDAKYPQYVEEMQGLADATDLSLATILALNIRTEVAFGMYSDGCTSLSVHAPGTAILAQNWDWKVAQRENLITLNLNGGISFITEAGIIGKIGLCAAGVGVCLNAISALGVAYDRLPVHLALRAALDWAMEMKEDRKARAIVDRLKAEGVASAAHIFVADKYEGIGLEVSCKDSAEVHRTPVPAGTAVLHSNHYVEEHPDVALGAAFLHDSPNRLARIEQLVRADEGPVTSGAVAAWLCDEDNFPGSICRDKSSAGDSETLFSIIMDLDQAKARVKVGKTNGDGEVFTLAPRV